MLIGLFISKPAFTEAKWFVETRTKANGYFEGVHRSEVVRGDTNQGEECVIKAL